MSTVRVKFLHSCGDDRAGQRKPIDVKRARRLAWQGYVELLEEVPEAGIAEPEENAARPRPQASGPKPERRG